MKDIEDLMNMSEKELEQYSEELDWIRSCGVTIAMDQDLEFIEQMIEVELANRKIPGQAWDDDADIRHPGLDPGS